MRISLNWLKKYVNVNVSDEELIRLIGARLVEVEGVIDETTKYNNIYIAKVVSAEKIPDTHLTKCMIYVGEREIPKVEKDASGLVQVMCGAPNVREGMLAVWIAPGAVVPASVHEDAPFVIGKRKMLSKYDSYGMLAGADELDVGDDHSGIVEIDPSEAEAGDLFAEVFELNDLILEIENKSLTHRPDCFGLIGFAREVAGILGEKFEGSFSDGRPHARSFSQHFAQSSPRSQVTRLGRGNVSENDAGSAGKLSEKDSPNISIESPSICPRYTAIVIEKHGEMKRKYLTWIDTVLSKAGMRPIDPIVDATNYLMLLYGQPLHAFDYEKFLAVGGRPEAEILVRLAHEGESLRLLDGKEVELKPYDIVICSGNVPVALAGAMGGASTEIDSDTRKVIIEAATFSLYNLRKTQMAHGIFSEAITRFTKGQPPYQTMFVGTECAEMLSDGFQVVSVSDEYLKPEKPSVVRITTDEINMLLGTEYENREIVETLENVGFEIKAKRGDLEITAPAWRTDISIREDIIEEVGRLKGYDNIAPTLPKHGTAGRNKMIELKTGVRDILSSFGANEVLTYSFVSEKILKKAGLSTENSYKIVNSISPDLQYVRQSIVPSLLEKAYMNQKLPVDKFAIFEMNKVYQKDWGLDEENVPVEAMRLGFVIAERKGKGVAYYTAKYYAEKLLLNYNIMPEVRALSGEATPESSPFESKRAAELWFNNRRIGVVGEFKNSVRRNYKLADYLAGFEIDLDAVLELKSAREIKPEKNVKNRIDETVTTTKNYAEVYEEIVKRYPNAEITPIGIYQAAGQESKNITFHIELLS